MSHHTGSRTPRRDTYVGFCRYNEEEEEEEEEGLYQDTFKFKTDEMSLTREWYIETRNLLTCAEATGNVNHQNIIIINPVTLFQGR